MNLAEHFNLFYMLTSQPDRNYISTDELINLFDIAERETNHKAHCVRTSNIFNSEGNKRLYDLDTYLPGIVNFHVDDIYYSNTDSTERRALEKISLNELNFISKGWKETDNIYPRFYYVDIEKNSFGLHPIEKTVATGTNCIEAVYRGEHTKMTTYYTTGTISINKGTKIVTGLATLWDGNVASGDKIGIGKLLDSTTRFPIKWYTIDEVSSDTGLTITENFVETSVSGVSYIIASPSSINNAIFNQCSIYFAMAEYYLKSENESKRNNLVIEAYAKISKENKRINKNYNSNKINIPAGNYPYPGNIIEDYRG